MSETLIINFQDSVGDAAVELYDRYVAVKTAAGFTKTISFDDFFNQIVVVGLATYAPKLVKLEKNLE